MLPQFHIAQQPIGDARLDHQVRSQSPPGQDSCTIPDTNAADRRRVPYAYIYPLAEFGAGVLMLAGAAPWLSAPVALAIGGIGAVSVFKAVYIDKRDLTCACVGGSSNVPLGFVSLTENVMMAGMAVAVGATLF